MAKTKTTSPAKLNVLMLDFPGHYSDLAEIAELVTLVDFPHSGLNHRDIWYCPQEHKKRVKEIVEIANSGRFDLIILGNNMNGGLTIAPMIDDKLRNRIIVAFNSPKLEEERMNQYIKLGINWFSLRGDLQDFLDAVCLGQSLA